MESRGGGVLDIHLKDCTSLIRDYYQISIVFDTIDSMGANFINTILEQTAVTLTDYCSRNLHNQANCEILMSILSNYSPECKVKCSVEAPVSVFNNIPGLAEKFVLAVSVAKSDIYRCVTHNKGIMNGIDAVLLATGNDFRAVEANVHAYASSEGKYTSLSEVSVTDGIFNLTVRITFNCGYCRRSDNASSFGFRFTGYTREPFCQAINDDYCICRTCFSFLSHKGSYYRWYSERTYENAPFKYFTTAKCL